MDSAIAQTANARDWLDSIRERRGLMAVEHLKAGDVVVSVPWSRCLSSEHLENRTDHPLSFIPRDYKSTLSSADILALFILYEYYNPRSELAPYLCA
jgi:hypothetical protein